MAQIAITSANLIAGPNTAQLAGGPINIYYDQSASPRVLYVVDPVLNAFVPCGGASGSADPFYGMTRAQILASASNVDTYYNGYNATTAPAAHYSAYDVTATCTSSDAQTMTYYLWFTSAKILIKVTALS